MLYLSPTSPYFSLGLPPACPPSRWPLFHFRSSNKVLQPTSSWSYLLLKLASPFWCEDLQLGVLQYISLIPVQLCSPSSCCSRIPYNATSNSALITLQLSSSSPWVTSHVTPSLASLLTSVQPSPQIWAGLAANLTFSFHSLHCAHVRFQLQKVLIVCTQKKYFSSSAVFASWSPCFLLE